MIQLSSLLTPHSLSLSLPHSLTPSLSTPPKTDLMELPQLRPVSKCGWACFSCCNAVLVAMASVAFSGE